MRPRHVPSRTRTARARPSYRLVTYAEQTGFHVCACPERWSAPDDTRRIILTPTANPSGHAVPAGDFHWLALSTASIRYRGPTIELFEHQVPDDLVYERSEVDVVRAVRRT